MPDLTTASGRGSEGIKISGKAGELRCPFSGDLFRTEFHSYQTVFRSGLRRIISSRVIRVRPSARAVAPISRSAGSRG